MKLILFLSIILIHLNLNVFAKQISTREKLIFEKGVNLYTSGQYKDAEKNFALVVERLPGSSFVTSNHLMLIKTQYKLSNYSSAINQTKRFLSLYPESQYKDDVLFTQGDCYYKLNRYESAIKSWLTALEITNDYRLEKKLKDRIFKSVVGYFSADELKGFSENIKSDDGKLVSDMASYVFAIAKGNKNKARLILEKSINENNKSKFYAEAQNLLNTQIKISTNTYRIALLLPMTGHNPQISKEIQEGVEFSTTQFNSQNDYQIEIVVKDYGQEITSAIIALKEIARDKSIIAVYGPIENDVAAACAAISEYEALPLFSPTASEINLSRLSSYFNQLNSPVNSRAEYLANFAIDSLGIKRFATFSPIENQFVKLIDEFVATCEQNGAEIIGQEWYYPGEQDFYKKFMNLKRKGLKLTFSDSLHSAEPELTEIEIDSLYKIYLQEKLDESGEDFVKVDSADIPVTTIEGLFIPIYQEDLKFIAPQIAYSNIQTQVLGNADWYNPDELKKNKNYIDGIIFLSDGFLNEENWDYKKFRNDFRNIYKKTPTVYNLIGYDTFSYILQYFQNLSKPISRQEFYSLSKNKSNYSGLYRKIHLNDQNYNSKVQLIKYKYGQFLPLN